MRSRLDWNVASWGSMFESRTIIRLTTGDRRLTTVSPSAAVGLEAARGAAPDRVHAIHLLAATLTQRLVRRRRTPERRRSQRGRRGGRGSAGSGIAADYYMGHLGVASKP